MAVGQRLVVGGSGLGPLLELANVFCGEVVELLGGEESVIGVGIPEEIEAGAYSADVRTFDFDSMGEALRVGVLSGGGAA